MFISEQDFNQEQLEAIYRDLDNAFVSEMKKYNRRVKKAQRGTISFAFKREIRVNKNLFEKVYCFFKYETPFFVSRGVGTLDYEVICISR